MTFGPCPPAPPSGVTKALERLWAEAARNDPTVQRLIAADAALYATAVGALDASLAARGIRRAGAVGAAGSGARATGRAIAGGAIAGGAGAGGEAESCAPWAAPRAQRLGR